MFVFVFDIFCRVVGFFLVFFVVCIFWINIIDISIWIDIINISIWIDIIDISIWVDIKIDIIDFFIYFFFGFLVSLGCSSLFIEFI